MPTKTDSPAKLVEIDHNDVRALEHLAKPPTAGDWFNAQQAADCAAAAQSDLRRQIQRHESQVKGLHHDIAKAFRAGKDASAIAVKAAKHAADADALRQQHDHMQQAARFLHNEMFAAQRDDAAFRAWQRRRADIRLAFNAINADAVTKFPLEEGGDPSARIEWKDRKRRALVSDILAGGAVG